MSRIFVVGGKELNGEVTVSGSKNASLPIIAASLLTDQEIILESVPKITDIENMVNVVTYLGKECEFIEENTLRISGDILNSGNVDKPFHVPIRASCLVMGPTLARRSRIAICSPGGCAIGKRPIDFHLSSFEKMGAKSRMEGDKIALEADRLVGTKIMLPKISVGATQNVMMAAVLSEGETFIHNAAIEPEIQDLIDFLNGFGADITWESERVIKIKGVKSIKGGRYKVIPDRMEASTYLVMAAAVGGSVKINNVDPSSIESVLQFFNTTGGLRVSVGQNSLHAERISNTMPIDFETDVYPGVPTDVQPQLTSLLAISPGVSSIIEKIFENRFTHVPELAKMGAKIDQLNEQKIHVRGVESLQPSDTLVAPDLRAGAALIIAALSTNGGVSTIDGFSNVERGYESIISKLTALGLSIGKV